MSLFKICNWWTVQSSDVSSSYDSFSLHCCRLGLEENDRDYVIVGSHNGSLCIYKPVYSQDEDEPLSFAPSDVIVELQLSDPIIGLTAGKFSPVTKNENSNVLAILHPMRLVICSVVTTMGIADTGDCSRLQVLQEYHLRSPAFTLCKGYFGGIKGREFICVNHLDGHLKFFEQEGITFECYLPDERTIPAVFLYVPRVDCFLTLSPAWELECFRYQDLIDADQLKKKVVPIWSLCVGEGAVDINIHQITNTESNIVMLGDNNLICVSDTGKVKFIKRLDYTPVALCSFVIGWYWEPNARLIIVVASENGSLLVYDSNQLIWAAELSSVPVAIQRANIIGLPGALVTLGRNGSINVGYLGSDPHLFKAPPLDLKQLDFIQAHSELVELEAIIQQSTDLGDTAMVNAAAERYIKFQVNVGQLEKCTYQTKTSVLEDVQKMVRISIGVKAIVDLEQIQLCVNVIPPLKLSNERQMYLDLKSDQNERFDTLVYVERSADVPSPFAKLVISIILPDITIRVIEYQIELPLGLFCKPTHHQKEAKYRVTLMVSEKEANDLGKLFPDFYLDSISQAIGLRSLYNGITTTVAVSKTSSRLRVQSDHIEAIACELRYILRKIKNDAKVVMSPSDLPVESLVEFTKEHQNLRDNFNYILYEMDRRNAELRLFELRYNVKSQEPNSKIQGIQYLIDLTHSKINALEKRLKDVEEEINLSQIRLSCILSVICEMIKYIGVSKCLAEMVKAAMCPIITNFLEQSWQELMSPALDYILHSTLIRKDNKTDEIDYLTVTRHEFNFEKFLKQLQEVFTSIMPSANKIGSHVDAEDDFIRTDSTDVIEEEKNDWVNEELSAAATMLIGKQNSTVNEINDRLLKIEDEQGDLTKELVLSKFEEASDILLKDENENVDILEGMNINVVDEMTDDF